MSNNNDSSPPESSKSLNWLYLAIIPLLAALISAGYFKEEIVAALTWQPNYFGLTNQYSNTNKDLHIYEEDWRLTTFGQSFSAKVKPRDLETTWTYKGSARGRALSGSYLGAKEDGSGIGNIFLREIGNNDAYIGYIVVNDCTVDEVVKCPYVLVPANLSDQARSLYADHLKQGCETLFKLQPKECKAKSISTNAPIPTEQ